MLGQSGAQRPALSQGALDQGQTARCWSCAHVSHGDGGYLAFGQEFRDPLGLAADHNDALPRIAHLLAAVQNPFQLAAIALAMNKRLGQGTSTGTTGNPPTAQHQRMPRLEDLAYIFPSEIGCCQLSEIRGQFAGPDQVSLKRLGLAIQIHHGGQEIAPIVDHA